NMKRIIRSSLLLLLLGCGEKEFKPDLGGWQTYTHPARRVHLEIEGRQKTLQLPGDERVTYRYAQWAKVKPEILLVQLAQTDSCVDYQLVAVDTTGVIVDTVYTAPPNTPVNFKLAPNDSLLLLKTYNDNCADESYNFKYTFYNRYTKTALPDTIVVGNARGIPLPETVWSPDAKKVIIAEQFGNRIRAFAYELTTKDTTYIDKASNFIWSPIDNNIVAYIKEYSIYTKNMATGEEELIYEGKRKRSVADFRWSPHGDFLMINIYSYILNIDKPMFRRSTIIYFSLADKTESKVFLDERKIDTWK
ncbi:MAG: hypothetical protein ACOYXT_27270, partial [Bacteroidota bacterium]